MHLRCKKKPNLLVNSLAAAVPMVCLDHLTDAFQGGALNMASSVAGRLHSVGYDMPQIFDVKPMLDKYSVFA